MSSARRHKSYSASLSSMNAQSEWSIIAWVARIELYGSTTAVETCGAG
jgi:hypothetical protein